MAVALLAGCAVGPDYEQPQVPSPTAFGSADAAVYGAAEPALAWWQTLDDPLLHEWLETALLQNHDLRIAETNLRAARAVLGARKLERYPIATSQLSALEQEQSAAVSLAPDRDQRIYDAIARCHLGARLLRSRSALRPGGDRGRQRGDGGAARYAT